MTKSKNKLVSVMNITSLIIVVMAFLLLVSFAISLFIPIKVMEIVDNPLKILNDNKTVEKGEVLYAELHYIKHHNLVGMSTKQFQNTFTYTTIPVSSNLKIGDNQIIYAMAIPNELPVGRYKVYTTIAYQVLPWRVVTVDCITEEFKVVAKCD